MVAVEGNWLNGTDMMIVVDVEGSYDSSEILHYDYNDICPKIVKADGHQD